MDELARQTIEQLLRKQQHPDQARLHRQRPADRRLQRRRRAAQGARCGRCDAVGHLPLGAVAMRRARPGWMRELGLKAMPLGLDLRGGLYLLYQVDVNSAVTQLLDSYEQSFRRALVEAKLPFTRRDHASAPATSSIAERAVACTWPPGADTGAVQAALAQARQHAEFHAPRITPPARWSTWCSRRRRSRRARTMRWSRIAPRSATASMSWACPSRSCSARAWIASWCSCRACRTPPRSRTCSARSRRSSFAWWMSQDNAFQAQQSGHVPLGDKLYKQQDGTPILLKREIVVTGDELTQATSTTGQDGPTVNIRLDARGADSMLRTTRAERRPAAGGGLHREEPPAGGRQRQEGRPRDHHRDRSSTTRPSTACSGRSSRSPA